MLGERQSVCCRLCGEKKDTVEECDGIDEWQAGEKAAETKGWICFCSCSCSCSCPLSRSFVVFNERMNGVASAMALGQVVTQRRGRRYDGVDKDLSDRVTE